jgi:hypothetical protein
MVSDGDGGNGGGADPDSEDQDVDVLNCDVHDDSDGNPIDMEDGDEDEMDCVEDSEEEEVGNYNTEEDEIGSDAKETDSDDDDCDGSGGKHADNDADEENNDHGVRSKKNLLSRHTRCNLKSECSFSCVCLQSDVPDEVLFTFAMMDYVAGTATQNNKIIKTVKSELTHRRTCSVDE